MEEYDYWFEDLHPQTWQDVIEEIIHVFTNNQHTYNYSHARAERIRAMY